MKNKRNAVFLGRSWLFWSLLILILLSVSCLLYAIFLYHDVMESKTAGVEETKEQILQATSITKIDRIEQFNGADSYHVVFGQNEDNEEKIIFYPLEGNEKTLTTIDKSEVITEESIKTQWMNECNDCDLLNIVPALIDDTPLWEITYNDNSNRYILDYLSIYDGSRYEQYRLIRMFQ
ncbi:cell wall elongation regulator TseB-like domain-containing protein [Virgibacillus natechei]